MGFWDTVDSTAQAMIPKSQPTPTQEIPTTVNVGDTQYTAQPTPCACCGHIGHWFVMLEDQEGKATVPLAAACCAAMHRNEYRNLRSMSPGGAKALHNIAESQAALSLNQRSDNLEVGDPGGYGVRGASGSWTWPSRAPTPYRPYRRSDHVQPVRSEPGDLDMMELPARTGGCYGGFKDRRISDNQPIMAGLVRGAAVRVDLAGWEALCGRRMTFGGDLERHPTVARLAQRLSDNMPEAAKNIDCRRAVVLEAYPSTAHVVVQHRDEEATIGQWPASWLQPDPDGHDPPNDV